MHGRDGSVPVRTHADVCTTMVNRCASTGHLREDFAIPHHLCPVCLSKVKHVFGTEMDLGRRAAKLLAFFSSRQGFEAEAEWVRKATAGWDDGTADAAHGDGGGEAAEAN